MHSQGRLFSRSLLCTFQSGEGPTVYASFPAPGVLLRALLLSLRDVLSPTSVVIPKLLHAHTSIRAMPPQSGRGFVLSPEAHARPVLLAATEEEDDDEGCVDLSGCVSGDRGVVHGDHDYGMRRRIL